MDCHCLSPRPSVGSLPLSSRRRLVALAIPFAFFLFILGGHWEPGATEEGHQLSLLHKIQIATTVSPNVPKYQEVQFFLGVLLPDCSQGPARLPDSGLRVSPYPALPPAPSPARVKGLMWKVDCLASVKLQDCITSPHLLLLVMSPPAGSCCPFPTPGLRGPHPLPDTF